jgi:hypothetical protein
MEFVESMESDIPSIRGFLASQRFQHRSKLDQLGIGIDSFDEKSAIFGSNQYPGFASLSMV